MNSNESQATDVGNGAQMQSQKDQPWLKIGDEEIHILHPLYRLHNSGHYVQVQGVLGLTLESVNRATAVVLTLCDGKRTVADIARITRPLVKNIADDAKAIEVAKEKVKRIIFTMSLTAEERKQQPKLPSPLAGFPAAILISRAEYDKTFSRTKFTSMEYHARDFLPKDSSEMTLPHFYNRHDRTPVNLNWHLTSDCSTDCRYCYLGRRKVKPMPKERTLALIEEAAAIGVVGILPTGGDVLLYPYLGDILQALCRHKFLPAALCTKSFLSKDKAKVLAENASVVLCLQFSIDSTVADVADYLVRGKDFCKRIFKSIDNALEVGLRVEAKAVVTPYNILTIPKLYRDLKKRGVGTIRLAAYCRSGFHHSDDLFNHTASYQWLEEQTQQLRQEYPDDLINIQNGGPALEPLSPEARQKGWSKRSMCTAGRDSMMICTDGKVIPCEQMPETEEYFCGDVSHQSIMEVWNGDRLRELTYGIPREKFKGTACYDCKEWEACCLMGNCIRDLSYCYGNVYQPPANCPKHNLPYLRMQ
jgi:radical SAM protein with 4Fe4S-binding SPASM domain